METPVTSLAAKNGLSLGYGLGIRSELFKGHRIYQHGGDADGYLAHFGYNKDSKRGYFIVINAFRHDILQQFKTELNHWLIENLSKPKSLLSAIISQQHLQTLTGRYQPASYRFSPSQNQGVEIKVENKLYRRLSNESSWFELVPVSKWLFRYAGEPEATVAFAQTINGTLHLLEGDENYKKDK